MRHIAILPDERVPRNAEFKFKDRADALVKKWQQILNANKSANGAAESVSATQGPLSAAPISAAPVSSKLEGQSEHKEKEEATAVTQGTAAINLNGKSVDGEYLPFFWLCERPTH